MTAELRKAHQYIWLLLIIIVPVIIFFSIKDLNVFSSDTSMTDETINLTKAPLATFENDIVKTAVFESHLQIILKKTLKNASSVVYQMDDKGNKINILGQLTTSGIYKFNINNLPKGIIITDDLKQVEITKFSFKWD